MGNQNNKKKRNNDSKSGIIENRKEKVPKKEYKIIFVGGSGVGAKSNLINIIIGGGFDPHIPSTNACGFIAKHVDIGNNEELILNLWDTIGQEKFRQLTKLFLKDSDCVVLGYEVTKKCSFEEITNYWCNTIKEYLGCNLIYLVGNKIDLFDRREVSKEEGIEYAEKEKLRFFEISCKTKEGINEFYNDLVNQILELYIANN